MPTTERREVKLPPSGTVDFTPEHIAVAFLVKRFQELPEESLRDIASLIETVTNPNTPAEEKHEVFETIREILFPELVGGICWGRAGSIEESSEKLERHTDHVSKTIKEMRLEKKLTQAQLAVKSGLPQAHISRLEAGVHSPSFKTIEKIAKALDVTVGDIDPSN